MPFNVSIEARSFELVLNLPKLVFLDIEARGHVYLVRLLLRQHLVDIVVEGIRTTARASEGRTALQASMFTEKFVELLQIRDPQLQKLLFLWLLGRCW